MSVTVKAACITSVALIICAVIGAVYGNSSDNNDAKLMRKMIAEYAKCGCKITIPRDEVKGQRIPSDLKTNNKDKIEAALKNENIKVIQYGTDNGADVFKLELKNN